MLKIKWRSIGLLTTILVMVAACTDSPPPAEVPVEASIPTTQALADPAPRQAAEATSATSAPPDADPTLTSTPPSLPDPTATAIPSDTGVEPESPEDERTSSEPSLADILLVAFPETPQAQGEVVYVTGRVLDTTGDPIANAAVEFWQTDARGFYDHPGDPATADRDQTFQFYGTALSDNDGFYMFRTISPGYYEPRPKHIHLKIKVDGRQMLTSQFYFEEDRAGLAGEGLFRQAGDLGELLILQEVGVIENEGQANRILNNDIVVDTGIGEGTLTLTPSQGEGPYYPVVNVALYDNDLTVLP